MDYVEDLVDLIELCRTMDEALAYRASRLDVAGQIRGEGVDDRGSIGQLLGDVA
ncbi:MAG TPA: hypothetical protein VGI39_01075 [Polyangiaceae bacterium]|jgi:hypothetical protein